MHWTIKPYDPKAWRKWFALFPSSLERNEEKIRIWLEWYEWRWGDLTPDYEVRFADGSIWMGRGTPDD